jgi:hypothetical protein
MRPSIAGLAQRSMHPDWPTPHCVVGHAPGLVNVCQAHAVTRRPVAHQLVGAADSRGGARGGHGDHARHGDRDMGSSR